MSFFIFHTGSKAGISFLLILYYSIYSCFRADKDKLSRALPISAKIEGGKVYSRKNSHWQNDFEKELVSFPNSNHDDQTDAFAYINQLVYDSSAAGEQEKYSKIYLNQFRNLKHYFH